MKNREKKERERNIFKDDKVGKFNCMYAYKQDPCELNLKDF